MPNVTGVFKVVKLVPDVTPPEPQMAVPFLANCADPQVSPSQRA
jgi:hypothetical protein